MPIVMLNGLIAILSDSYSKTTEESEGYKYKEKLELIRELYSRKFDYETFKESNKGWLFYCKEHGYSPENENESSNQEILSLFNTTKDNITKMNESIETKINELSEELKNQISINKSENTKILEEIRLKLDKIK